MARRRRRDDARKPSKHERQSRKRHEQLDKELEPDDDYMPERRSSYDFRRAQRKRMDMMVAVVAIVIIFTVIGGYFFYEEYYNQPESGSEEDIDIQPHKANPVVVIDMKDYGDMRVELFLERAPITAKNFLDLAKSGKYDNSIFHRVIENFMIQGGDFANRDGTGGHAAEYHENSGNPTANPDESTTWVIPDEFHPELSNVRGTLSMANSGPNTGGSQFFINVVDNTNLDYNKEPLTSKHAVFGKVISGMDTADEISEITEKDGNNKPLNDVVITRIYEA
jgi:cyclophilin family peptidyl-prolyl cis-trans isomerase